MNSGKKWKPSSRKMRNMTDSNDVLSEKPITYRRELVERAVAAFGKPNRMNSKEVIWNVTRH